MSHAFVDGFGPSDEAATTSLKQIVASRLAKSVHFAGSECVALSGREAFVTTDSKVWNFKPQIRPFKFVGHKGQVNDVLFNADATRVISCGDDR